jgi:hypothetical protein
MANINFDDQLDQEREGENYDSAGVGIGSVAIIKWLRNQKEPESRDWWYKYFAAINFSFKVLDIDKEKLTKYNEVGVGLANELPYRHLLVKKFYYFEDNENLGILLTNLQTFVEIERQYTEPAYEEHQEMLDSIFEDEFEESSEKIDEIKKLAKTIVDKAREQGLDDCKAPTLAR